MRKPAIPSSRIFKQTLRTFGRDTQDEIKSVIGGRTPVWLSQGFKWMSPGLFVKRWMMMSAGGVLLVSLGLAIWTKLTPIAAIMQFAQSFFESLTRVVPSYISGPIVILLGFLLIFWGQKRTFGAITEVLIPDVDQRLVDVLLNHRRRSRGTKIVVVGGGTGLSTLLRGLKLISTNLTAVVTVADDGGSSGRLRREIGVLPPGDIRNCLGALADEEKLLTELFRYRFTAGDGLTGHSFGNLFLTAMSEITGDLERAVIASSKVLAIRGDVLPATLSDVKLWAELSDGRRIEGESNITEARGKIVQFGCIPENPPALPRVLSAIEEAEFIVIGPGSLYTSVIPNLLVPEIADAIARRRVPSVYVCNVMTQPGETDEYTVADHIRAIDRACGYRKLFDAVLVQRRLPSERVLRKYAAMHAQPVYLDFDEVLHLGRRVIRADVIDEDSRTGYIRHNSERLARVLMRWNERESEELIEGYDRY
ncbi:YvcK family protein [filamentous cyanobacterium LEGE 11480]|uniref:Putative gluconeogenesis factor n=1 Tax=Romeriopsis navalis LEGE 11480 TaxID=2777977 RepID=A0A928VL66_9CYAN|nr:uridine diphosphate-N-acetylglucosamine-binding protein YvcK [Romeriopsis navalis]MBE9028555.1 YvcK family protein [Romeriopsis navalis LEGE 11480]